jgi:hypothetical protein
MSIDWQRVEGRGDRAVVLCDQHRPSGLAFIIGVTVDIDGALYVVSSAEHRYLAGPIRKGEHVVFWVRPHFEARLPNVDQAGRG